MTYCQTDIFSRGAFILLHRQYPDRREDRERGEGRVEGESMRDLGKRRRHGLGV